MKIEFIAHCNPNHPKELLFLPISAKNAIEAKKAREEKKAGEEKIRAPKNSTSSSAWLLAETIVQYLEQRKARKVGKGCAGDLLEQFLGEWLTWALQDLPNLD